MRKEPSAAEKLNGDFAPKLGDLTDRVLFGDVWERQDRSTRDRSLVRSYLAEFPGELATFKTTDSNASPVWEGSHEGPGAPDVAKLARLIGTYAPHDGRFELLIPGVHAIRASRMNTELVHTLWQPGLCIVAQGAKRVMLGQNVYEYGRRRCTG
jgi:AraC-type transcriptional regulator N-terminus